MTNLGLAGKHTSQKAELAADLLYNQPRDVMDAVARKGIPWETIMDRVCGWSQAVSSITKCYFVVLFSLNIFFKSSQYVGNLIENETYLI